MKFYGWLTSGLELAGIFRLVMSIYSQYAVPRYVWRKHTAVAVWTEKRVLDVFLAVIGSWGMAKCFIIWQSFRLLPSTVCMHMLVELCVSVWNCLPDVACTMRRLLRHTVSRVRTINVEQTILVLEDVPIRLFDVKCVCSAGVWDFQLFEFYKRTISAAYGTCFEPWILFAVC